MLRLVVVDVLRDVLQAAGDVRRFVAGGGEDVVGGDDAADAEQKEAGRQHAGMLREKRFDAGFPDAWMRRARAAFRVRWTGRALPVSAVVFFLDRPVLR